MGQNQNTVQTVEAVQTLSEEKPSPALAQGQMVGQVRHPGMTYGIRLAWDGRQLRGRLGGVIFGENVLLERHAGGLLGTVASTSRVFAVSVQVEPGRLEYRFAGNPDASGATFWLGPEGAQGILYLAGSAQRASIEVASTGLSARIGHQENPVSHLGLEQQVSLEHGPLPLEIALTAALLADIASRNAWRILLSSYGAEG